MKRKKLWSAAWGNRCFTLCALILTASLAAGQSSKMSKDLSNLPCRARVNVVVQYYATPTSLDVYAAKSVGATNGKALGLIKGLKWTMSQGSVQSLIASDPNVKVRVAGSASPGSDELRGSCRRRGHCPQPGI